MDDFYTDDSYVLFEEDLLYIPEEDNFLEGDYTERKIKEQMKTYKAEQEKYKKERIRQKELKDFKESMESLREFFEGDE